MDFSTQSLKIHPRHQEKGAKNVNQSQIAPLPAGGSAAVSNADGAIEYIHQIPKFQNPKIKPMETRKIFHSILTEINGVRMKPQLT